MKTGPAALLVLGAVTLSAQETIPQGTRVRAELVRDLPAGSAVRLVSLRVTEPVIVNLTVVIEAGAPASGHLAGLGKEWVPDRVLCADGTWAPLDAAPLDPGAVVNGRGQKAGSTVSLYVAQKTGPIQGSQVGLGAAERVAPFGGEWMMEQSNTGFVAMLSASPKYLLLFGLLLMWFGFANEARKLHARRNDR